MNNTVIAFWNWTSITVEPEEAGESIEDIFTLDISVIIVLSVCLVSIVFCCVLQRYIDSHNNCITKSRMMSSLFKYFSMTFTTTRKV